MKVATTALFSGGSLSSTHLPPGSYGVDDLLPGGVKVRGANLTRNLTQHSTDPTQSSVYLWSLWDATDVQEQMDLAVEAGCNVVRIAHGSFPVVYSGAITEATYLSRWMDIMAWAESRGLYVYATIQNGNGKDDFSAIPYATYEGYATRLVEEIGPTRRCVAIDVVQESTAFATSASGQNLIAAVKGVTDLPCTYSIIGGDASKLGHATNDAAVSSLKDIVDFFDLHWYYNPASTDIETYWYGSGFARADFRLVVGEFGMAQSAGATAIQERYEAVASAVIADGASGHKAAGAVAWATRDYSTDASLKWGLFDVDDSERTYMTTPLKTIPTA